jgi:hypothetical protein
MSAGLKYVPGLARQQLDDVLVEIDRTFVALDDVVREYLEVALDRFIDQLIKHASDDYLIYMTTVDD